MATNRGRRRNLLLFLLAALLILVLTAGGCGWRQQEGLPEENGSKEGEGEQSAAGDDDMVRVTLYFADEQAENLVAEEREVEEDRLPAAIVEELIKGSETGRADNPGRDQGAVGRGQGRCLCRFLPGI